MAKRKATPRIKNRQNLPTPATVTQDHVRRFWREVSHKDNGGAECLVFAFGDKIMTPFRVLAPKEWDDEMAIGGAHKAEYDARMNERDAVAAAFLARFEEYSSEALIRAANDVLNEYRATAKEVHS
jgi:hypothetical protein